MKEEKRTITTEVTYWIADDGTEYTNQDECVAYEQWHVTKMQEFLGYDENFERVEISGWKYVIVPTESDVNTLNTLFKYYGYSYSEFTDTGVYMLVGGTWYNIKNKLSSLPWRDKFYENN
jgi:hypothetical protein